MFHLIEIYNTDNCGRAPIPGMLALSTGSVALKVRTDGSIGAGILSANAKAKANAAQGLPELIEIATEKAHKDNYKEKHNKDAKYGWYKYTSRFALPVYDSDGEIDRYNVFQVIMIVRHAEDEKMYLYDIMNIKKETSNLFQS